MNNEIRISLTKKEIDVIAIAKKEFIETTGIAPNILIAPCFHWILDEGNVSQDSLEFWDGMRIMPESIYGEGYRLAFGQLSIEEQEKATKSVKEQKNNIYIPMSPHESLQIKLGDIVEKTKVFSSSFSGVFRKINKANVILSQVNRKCLLQLVKLDSLLHEHAKEDPNYFDKFKYDFHFSLDGFHLDLLNDFKIKGKKEFTFESLEKAIRFFKV